MPLISVWGKALSINPDTKKVTIEVSRTRTEEYSYGDVPTETVQATLNVLKNWLVTDGVVTKIT